MKEELVKLLKQMNLEIKVDDYGYVQATLSLDGEEILSSNSIDLLEEIQDAKDSKEASCWV